MASDWFLLKTEFDPNRCVVDALPPGTKQEFRIKEGTPMGARFPKRAVMRMSKNYAGLAVADSIANTFDFLMASERLRALIAEFRPDDVEYLPFTLEDHKKKAVPGEFCIVNPLGSVACADAAKTEGKTSAMEPSQYLLLKRLWIDATKVPDGTHVFRLGEMTSKILVSAAFVKAAKKAGIEGVRYVGMGEKV